MDDSQSRSPTAHSPHDRGAESPLRTGAVLAGRYEIRQPLGRGGTGEVSLAFDLRLRVEVALKALQRRPDQNRDADELLHREVRPRVRSSRRMFVASSTSWRRIGWSCCRWNTSTGSRFETPR